jgi:hypothetical protein
METANLEALVTLTQLGAAVTLLFLTAWCARGRPGGSSARRPKR